MREQKGSSGTKWTLALGHSSGTLVSQRSRGGLLLGPSFAHTARRTPRCLSASQETINRHPGPSHSTFFRLSPFTAFLKHITSGHLFLASENAPECPHLHSSPSVASNPARKDPKHCGRKLPLVRTITKPILFLDHEQITLARPRCLPAARRARAQPNRSRLYHAIPIPRHLRYHRAVQNGVRGHITSFLPREDLYRLGHSPWMTLTIPPDLNRSGPRMGTMKSSLTPQTFSGMKKTRRLKKKK